MSNLIKRIGILTGGGDCPGLNAVIRAVAKSAIMQHGLQVFGIEDGFLGLVQNRISELTTDDVSGILTRGGTILGTSNKCDPSQYVVGTGDDGQPIFRDVTDRCLEHIAYHKLDAIICIGGDGTMSGAKNFVEHGVNCIGVPKTIDNDLVGTDITFGFMTAVYIATDALDRIHTTAASHHRAMVVEVMGRNAGWIALHAGVASGSDVILIPEIPYDLGRICEFIQERSAHGKRFSIICISEGARPKDGGQVVAKVDPTSPDPIRLGGIGEQLADDITQRTGIETRTTVLGHVQRGGTPLPADRILATRFGCHAVELIVRGERNRLVVMRNHEVTDTEIGEAADKQRTVPPDDPLIRAAESVGTFFGI
ncbi:MAG: 6-phosphofructokinase [Phycisphaerales bacterium]|nr:6-phosphofructokinase [Phycisphaerales bacterium]